MMATVWSILIAFAVSLGCALFLIRTRGHLSILDHPNDRSLHCIPVPRTGGLAIWAGTAAGLGVFLAAFGSITGLERTITAAILVVGISFMDDRSHVPVAIRLIIHAIASALIVSAVFSVETTVLPLVGFSPSRLVIFLLWMLFSIWMINLYNFMDGMDGLAGGMATLGFGALGLLGYLAGSDGFATFNWIIAAAAGGFLLWNFPPARIFMGDAGSATLGLLAAASAFWASVGGLFPLWISLLVFAPFVADASITLVRRLSNGERIWKAHRTHYYQRLVQAGWNHRRAVLWEYALMFLCASLAVVALRSSPDVQRFLILGIGMLFALAIFAVRRIETAFRKRHSGTPVAGR